MSWPPSPYLSCKADDRHVGILSVQGSQFQIAEIPLKTVRPFEMDEVVLSDCAQLEHLKVDLEDKDSITAFLRREVSFGMHCYQRRGTELI